MSTNAESLQTAVLGLPCAGTSTVFSILDVLASVGRDWEMLHGAPRQPPVFTASLVSLDGRPYDDPNGRRITPEAALSEYPAPALVIIPDLHLDPAAPLPSAFGQIAAWIKDVYQNGGMVTSVCSGALLLAESGLLNGMEATTHWGYSGMLSQRFPDVRLRRERILVPAGEGHRIITAGGASAWADLMLYLISRLTGADEARRIAKLYLLEPHVDGQLCYAALASGRQHEDKIIEDAQIWAANHYSSTNPVATMASRSGLSQRGFLRRFRHATGQSPVEYVQTLRVEESKQMLESTGLAIDEIAAEVGYSEPSSFRATFRKRVGISASVYRKKWQGISGGRGVGR